MRCWWNQMIEWFFFWFPQIIVEFVGVHRSSSGKKNHNISTMKFNVKLLWSRSGCHHTQSHSVSFMALRHELGMFDNKKHRRIWMVFDIFVEVRRSSSEFVGNTKNLDQLVQTWQINVIYSKTNVFNGETIVWFCFMKYMGTHMYFDGFLKLLIWVSFHSDIWPIPHWDHLWMSSTQLVWLMWFDHGVPWVIPFCWRIFSPALHPWPGWIPFGVSNCKLCAWSQHLGAMWPNVTHKKCNDLFNQ